MSDHANWFTNHVLGMFADVQDRHSDIQMDQFITLQNGHTNYGWYKQAVLEFTTRFRNVRHMLIGLAQGDLDIEELEDKLSRIHDKNSIDYRRKQLDLIVKQEKQAGMLASLKSVIAEMNRFFNQCLSLKETLPSLTPENRRRLEAEEYKVKVKSMAATDLMTQGRISKGTWDLARVCGEEFLQDFIRNTRTQNDLQNLMSWYNENPPKLPDVSDISAGPAFDIDLIQELIHDGTWSRILEDGKCISLNNSLPNRAN